MKAYEVQIRRAIADERPGGVPNEPNRWPEDTKLREREDTRSLCRKPRPISDFAIDLQRVNEQLATQDCTSLCDEEFWGARLYTGPMFIK